MPTREDWDRLLAELLAERDNLRRLTAANAEQLEAVEKARASAAATEEALTARQRNVKVNVNQMMAAKHRVAISGGRSYKSPFQKACLEAETTQGSVARAAGVTPAFLSMCVRGTKAAPLKLRTKAHDLVGWPLDGWKKLAE